LRLKNFLTINNYYPRLINPEKYTGRLKIITIRSSLELKMVNRLDSNKDVLKWSAEDKIFYYKDLTGKKHRYFIDFWIMYYNPNGVLTEKYIEVKPHYQTIPPKNSYSNYSKGTWVQNNLKWQAVREYCEEMTSDEKIVKFQIITEREL